MLVDFLAKHGSHHLNDACTGDTDLFDQYQNSLFNRSDLTPDPSKSNYSYSIIYSQYIFKFSFLNGGTRACPSNSVLIVVFKFPLLNDVAVAGPSNSVSIPFSR